MSEQAMRLMSADEFLEWCQFQEGRYELVDGALVAMTGARNRHDQILMNTHGTLYNQLRGHRCRAFSPDRAVRIPAGNVRRPVAGFDCGSFNEDETWADAPFLLVEILSPSTRANDLLDKLDEYKTIASLCHIVIVDPDVPKVRHWSRRADLTWSEVILEGLDAAVQIPDLPATLDLGTLYEGLTFRPRPRLVLEAEAAPR